MDAKKYSFFFEHLGVFWGIYSKSNILGDSFLTFSPHKSLGYWRILEIFGKVWA